MNSNKIVHNLLWKLLERFGSQIVSTIISVIIARLLDVDNYGVIALVTVIIAVLLVFTDSGLTTALIQKKDTDDLDYSSVFYTNIVLCLLVFAALYFFAPVIASFYNKPELTSIIRVSSLTVVVSGITNVQRAYISKNMMFRRFFFSTLLGTISGGVVGITMAYNGCGVWSLVGQQLTNTIVNSIVLWLTVNWKPKRCFSFERLKVLFGFGWKLLISGLIDTVYSQLRRLIIAKIYSTSDLAYYDKGEHFPALVVTNVNSSVDAILLPTMAQQQHNLDSVKSLMQKSIKFSMFLMAPALLGLAAVADNFILLLLTEKWLPTVPYLRIFCIIYLLNPIHTANLNAIKATGRSDVFLKLEIIKKAISLTILIFSIRISVWVMCVCLLFDTVLFVIINSKPNEEFLDYGYKQQLKDVFPFLALSVVMALSVYYVGHLIILSLFVTLLIQIVTGIAIYTCGAFLFKFEELSKSLSLIKQLIKNR